MDNTQNMFHGNHQGDYYRYDASSARPMGPPGGYPPRHRAPHPLQQQPQQPQYPPYQSPTPDNMYAMSDQHTGLSIGDISGWGNPTASSGAYGTPSMGYVHPQATQQQQRQPQSQQNYRQHISAYPQPDPQKMQYPTQQGMLGSLMQQPGYGTLSQAPQSQQQRVPHYPQSTPHPIYSGGQNQSNAGQPYGGYPANIPHQPNRNTQHVNYGHGLEQPNYGQHLQNPTPSSHHLGGPPQQQPPQAPSQQIQNLPSQPTQSHLNQPPQGLIPGQTAPQLHSSQIHHSSQQNLGNPGNLPQHSSLGNLPSVGNLHSHTPGSVVVSQTHSQQPTQQQSSHQQSGLLSSQHSNLVVHTQQIPPHLLGANTPVASQLQSPSQQTQNQLVSHQLQHGLVPGYVNQSQNPSVQSQNYLPGKQGNAQTSQTQQHGGSPQYRAPYPQLSPQMSPRPPQMSPHPQMSPRPVMSPAKPQPQPNAPSSLSPHMGVQSPRPSSQSSTAKVNQSLNSTVSTLQALEQMVMPTSNSPGGKMDYTQQSYRPPHQQIPPNPLSPIGPRMPISPQHQQQQQQQWNVPHRSSANINSNHMHIYSQHQQLMNQVPTLPPMNELNIAPVTQTLHAVPPPVNIQNAYQNINVTSNEIDNIQSISTSVQSPISKDIAPNTIPSNNSTDLSLMDSFTGLMEQPMVASQSVVQLSNSFMDTSTQSPLSENKLQQIGNETISSNIHSDLNNSNKSSEIMTNSNQLETIENEETEATFEELQPAQSHSLQSLSLPSAIDKNEDSLTCDSGQNILRPVVAEPVESVIDKPLESNDLNEESINDNSNICDNEIKEDSMSLGHNTKYDLPQSISNDIDENQEHDPNTNSPIQDMKIANSDLQGNDSEETKETEDKDIISQQIEETDTSEFTDDQPVNQEEPVSSQDIPLLIPDNPDHVFAEDSNLQDESSTANDLYETREAVSTQEDISDQQPVSTQSDSNSSSSIPSPEPPTLQEPVSSQENELSQEPVSTQETTSNQEPVSSQEIEMSIKEPILSDEPMSSEETTTELPSSSQEDDIPLHKIATQTSTSTDTRQQISSQGVTNESEEQKVEQSNMSTQQNKDSSTTQPTVSITTQTATVSSGQTQMYPNVHVMPHTGVMHPNQMMADMSQFPQMLHQQEKTTIQQQIQELYHIPASQENQDKIQKLQERLNLLQQHETNEQCSGGPQCVLLQNPIYNMPPIIESPQVTSTTGRGRGRGGIQKPRKPRMKKAEKLLQQSLIQNIESSDSSIVQPTTTVPNLPAVAVAQETRQLPVSEDCVTAGAGVDISESGTDLNESGGDVSQDGISASELDTSTNGRGRKKKDSKDMKKPRDPKDGKICKDPKIPKERKKKEPRDPNEPQKKRGRKPGSRNQSTLAALAAAAAANGNESAVSGSLNPNESFEGDTSTADGSISMDVHNDSTVSKRISDDSFNQTQNSCDAMTEKPSLVSSDEVTDFDDIPVSKIPIKSLLEEAAAKKAERELNENSLSPKHSDNDLTPTGRKRRSSGRRRGSKNLKGFKRGRKYRGGRLPNDSDGEGDDLMTTPPPSPPVDAEIDSSKRRSARNTQRKKYVDDVMIRFSDDESGIISPNSKKDKKENGENNENVDNENVSSILDPFEDSLENDKPLENNLGKPNYVYVNTTDEDSMVVQHVLASRIGRRELKPPEPKPEKKEKPDLQKIEETDDKEKSKLDSAPLEEDNTDIETDEMNKESNKEDEQKTEEQEASKINADENEEKEDDKSEEVEIDDKDTSEKQENEELKKVDNTIDSCENDQEEKDDSKSEKENEDEDNKKENMEVDQDLKEENEEERTIDEAEKSKEIDNEEEKEIENENEEKSECEIKSKNEEKSENEEKAESSTNTIATKSDTDAKPEPVYVEVEEFYVKYRNFSYLHCEWRTEEELYRGDRRIPSKIRRFQMKQAQQLNIFENIEEEPFNPDFVEVDRILDVSEHVDTQTGEKAKHYLVKWKSLPYEDSTWELEEDVDPIKIQQFEKFNKCPPKEKWRTKRRPNPEQWKKLDETPVFKNNNTLRPYQLEGLNWLKFSWYNGHNCILADEMGLGKTIQSLTFVNSLFEYGIRGPFLVIAPLSTIPNWQREFESWTDLNVIVYHGSVTSKQMLTEYEFYYKNEAGKQIKDIIKFNVLITTFEMIVTDYAELKQFNWRCCVIDEAHRLKNRNCKLLEALRQLNLEHRLLLSGTPLQNNVSELFSLLNFLEPAQFSSSEEFLKEFGSLKTESEVQKLQALLKPMMLRRLKDDVEKSLAPKEETIVEVELTNIQKKYYRGILEQNFSFLKKGTTSANIPNLMNTMMELRKCCIHPYLLNGAEDQIQYDYKQQHGEDPESYYKNLIISSGKMVLIDKLLPKLRANGHRVLIFSQMVRCLDILEDYLIYRKYPFERIDGRIRGELRQAAIDRYSKPDSDRFCFLLCTKAGGLGINLTAADTVIIYDSDWNPQNDLQAQARCHRIGQQKMVKIYRLLCRNTYEREMFDKASLKLGLDKAILQSMNTSQGSKDTPTRQLSKKEIEDLLKKGAYGAIMDDDNAGDKFCEEDIDSILERRTQIITMESEKGSTFSKASFAASGNRSDINIDDPDFWKKWAKKADIDPTVSEKDDKEELVISEPRRRTQIKRYGHDESVMEMSDEDSEQEEEDGIGLRSKRKKDKLAKKKMNDDYIPRDRDTLAALGFEEVVYGNWARSECFKVEKGLLSYGWGRWVEILEHGQFKRGWREIDIEDCARIILLYCLNRYQGDEKIKNFIWDLIAPSEGGVEQKISRNHSGLHNLVPRGRNAKGGKGPKEPMQSQKDCSIATPSTSTASMSQSILDPTHWSKDEKYDAESFLEHNYKKHLSRHANKVLLRVRMLYYIKHEIIGDLVQQISDGVKASNDDDNNSKYGDTEDVEDDTATKDSEARSSIADSKDTIIDLDRPGSSAGLDDDESLMVEDGTWPSMQDLNTRLRRVITSYQRNYKKEELKQQQKAKLQALTTSPSMMGQTTSSGQSMGVMNQSQQQMQQTNLPQANQQQSTNAASNSSLSSAVAAAAAAVAAQQQQPTQHQQSQQNNANQTALPSAADFSLMLSLGLGLNPAEASQIANWDLQKLAMYLKMERREKFEQVVREREKSRYEAIQKKWTRREEIDFMRVLTGYGIDLQPHSPVPTPDWSRFKTLAKLDKKTDDSMSDYYKVLIAMCKRQAGVMLTEEEKGLEGIIDDISEDHAKLVLDRLELLSKLREIIRYPKLDERLQLCQTNLDTPDWWEPGKHDKELIRAVLKHGLYNSEHFIFNDPQYYFYDTERKFVAELELQNQKSIKVDTELLKFDKNEIVVKLEKGEGTLKIEKIKKESENDEFTEPKEDILKMSKKEESVENLDDKENEESKEEKEEEPQDVQNDDVEKEIENIDENLKESSTTTTTTTTTTITTTTTTSDQSSQVEEEDEKKDTDDDEVKVIEKSDELEEKKEELVKEEVVETIEIKEESEEETVIEKEKDVEDECIKQAAELKARFPDLEVIQPLPKTKIIDQAFINKDTKENPVKSYKINVRWFRDFALEKRISHIIYCVENNEWPVGKSYSAYTGCQGIDLDAPLYDTIRRIPTTIDLHAGRNSSTPDVITITTDQSMPKPISTPPTLPNTSVTIQSLSSNQQALNNQSINIPSAVSATTKKRKRHIAIDVETERAKLHALLNNTQNPPAVPTQNQKPTWASNLDDDISESKRVNTPSTMQPPPAHQHQPISRSFNKPTVIPGTSSTLTPIDLSSSLPKVNMADIIKKPVDLSEVQDFSTKKSSSSADNSISAKGKLDDMLTKLMKKNNCYNPPPLEEPVIGKEKKRRKLDEIVLGLSAAKEQKSVFTEPSSIHSSKKPQIPPSVSVTPASAPSSVSSSQHSSQKPFTITVTSVPGSSKSNNPSNAQGLQALQNMANLSGSNTKDAFNLFEHQAFLKQQQKLIQQLPANSPQRKTYEAMFNEMKQAAELSSKLASSYGTHDSKVNKWLAEQTQALQNQVLQDNSLLDYRRSRNRTEPQQSQSSSSSTTTSASNFAYNKNWTGEENIPVINKLTGKRLSGNKAPQLKRLLQWLSENPGYEIDPKFTEFQTTTAASPKPSPSESPSPISNSSKSQQHRSSSSNTASTGNSGNQCNMGQYSSNTGSSSSTNTSKKRTSSSAQDQASMFNSLAGFNANLLSSLPQLGNFDPKNPLLMPFAGMPGLAGLGGLGTNMNFFANLAGLGLTNLPGMDPQTVAAMLAASTNSNLGNLDNTRGSNKSANVTSSKNRKESERLSSSQSSTSTQQTTSSSSSSKTPATSTANLSNSSFPFYLPNPNLLYSPLGLGGLNPYSLPASMSAYDQLAQQYLLNGPGLSSGSTSTSTTSLTTSGSRQSSGSSGSASNKNSLMSSSQRQNVSSQSNSPSGKNRSSSNLPRDLKESVQIQNLLLPQEAHLLESLSRATGLDLVPRSSEKKSSRESSSSSSQQQMLSKEAMDKCEKERKKMMDNLSRTGAFSSDLSAMHAFAQGKLPTSMANTPTSSSSSSKNFNTKDIFGGISSEVSQALFNEMAAQAAAAAAAAAVNTSSNSSKRSREQEMKELFEQLSKSQVELFARNLGMSSAISLIPTSSSSSSTSSSNLVDETIKQQVKRARHSEMQSLLAASHESLNKERDREMRERERDREREIREREREQREREREIRDREREREHREREREREREMRLLEQQQQQQQQREKDRDNSGALSLVTSVEEKSKSRLNDNSGSATIEKVSLSPAAAASIASLPSQTTITIAPPTSSHEVVAPTNLSPKISTSNTSVGSSSSNEKLVVESQHEMDIEELIAPSKVSKPASIIPSDEVVAKHMESESESDKMNEIDLQNSSGTSNNSSCGASSNNSNKNSNIENSNNTVDLTTDNDKKQSSTQSSSKRVTRGKRPRYEEVDIPVVPERKRELRSSAGRAAAAAAARMAAEAKQAAAAAANNESLNLSTSDKSDSNP